MQEALAKKVLEVEFFRGALRRIEARRRPSSEDRRDCIYEQVQVMQAQGGLTIERMCELGQVSRGDFIVIGSNSSPGRKRSELRARMQRIVLTHRGNYGYRR